MVAIPVLWIIWFVVTLLHELGHLIFAWFARLEVHEFQAGFLQAKPNSNRWSFAFIRPQLSGWVILEPNDGTQSWRKKVAICTAGGPIANLLIVALSLPATAMPILGLSLVGFGFLLISAMQLVLSLYPSRSNKGFLSDGANLLAFLRSQPMTN